jgi:Cu+-exporting ATPase
VLPEQGHDEGEVLRLAASLERGSEHPLAEAIVRGAEERGVAMKEAGDFEAVTGKGVKGTVDGRAVALGNVAMVRDLGLDVEALAKKADARRDQGETVMFVVLGDEVAGLVSVADPVKETTPAALKELHALGFRIIMATGDNERTAKAVAARLGIDEIRADVLPQDKARIIRELQEQGRKVASQRQHAEGGGGQGDGGEDPALPVAVSDPGLELGGVGEGRVRRAAPAPARRAAHSYTSRNRRSTTRLMAFMTSVMRKRTRPTAKMVLYSMLPYGVSPRLTCTM